MDIPILVEIIVVAVIVVLQFVSFFANKKRMDEYMEVFGEDDTWDVERDDFGNVSSITGGGSNSYFRQIKNTINKYIAGSANSVADYQILKEAVDRHCDSIEDQIESQTPVPLYLGLAGTMIGVIIGLSVFVFSGAISDLASTQNDTKKEIVLSKNSQNDVEFRKAADGITSLLSGVAIAMIASFSGILMTTIATYNYKIKKENAEKNKNEFMSWMQSVLLPELPNDISGALAQLVEDLEGFNKKFEQNTSSLSKTFDNVNEAYKTQADIVKAVRDMDVQKMASANVLVLEKLEKSTEKLERFNQYLDRIEGYTATIQKFNEQFHQEESQLGLLKKIFDFFQKELTEIEQRKYAIGDAVSSVDNNLKKSFKDLENSFDEQLNEFREKLNSQSETFAAILEEQRNSFTESNNFLRKKLDEELRQYPETLAQLKRVSEIPGELKSLTSSMRNEMGKLASEIVNALEQRNSTAPSGNANIQIPASLKWFLIGFGTIISICAILAAIFCGIAAFKPGPETFKPIEEEMNVSEPVDTAIVDTASVSFISQPKDISLLAFKK